MRNLKSKVERLENKICPEKDIVVFTAGGPDREEDFERQKAEYLKSGGNPDALFVMVITWF